VREIFGIFDVIKGLLGTISGLSALYGIIAWKVLYPKYQESIAKKIIYKRKCNELRDFALEQGGFQLREQKVESSYYKDFSVSCCYTQLVLVASYMILFIVK
jgi:hypothetical protein